MTEEALLAAVFAGGALFASVGVLGWLWSWGRALPRWSLESATASEPPPPSVVEVAQPEAPAATGPIAKDTPIGQVWFAHNKRLGSFGELMTSVIMGTRGYYSLPSKLDEDRGIDGIFVLMNSKGPSCLVFTETKIDGGKPDNCAEPILSNAGIKRRVKQLKARGSLREDIARWLLARLDDGAVRIERHHVHHEFNEGMFRTRMWKLGEDGIKAPKAEPDEEVDYSHLCASVLSERCRIEYVPPDADCQRE